MRYFTLFVLVGMRFFTLFVLVAMLPAQQMPPRRPTPMASTGYKQLGAARVWGPNGLEAMAAYQFEDFCTPNPTPGLRQCYQIKLVLDKPVSGYAPDLLYTETVYVWGDPAGHFWWECGGWKLEMIALEETLRQQVSWEAEKLLFRRIDAGPQNINITVGKDVLLITVVKPV